MADGLFSRIDGVIDSFLTDLVSVFNTSLVSGISLILTSSITLYIVFFGYMVWAGKIKRPLEDLLWDLGKFAIILSFINNTGDLLDLFKEAVEALSTLGNPDGGSGIAYLDTSLELVSKASDTIANKAPWYSEWFVAALVWIGYLLSVVPVFLLLLVTKLTMFLLLALSPIFLFCLMWGFLKESFSNYLSALLSNALVIIVVTTLHSSLIKFFIKTMNDTGTSANTFLVGFALVVVGYFSSYIILYLVNVVGRLMKVSIDSVGRATKVDMLRVKNLNQK